MARIDVTGFGGIIPRLSSRMLPQNCAAEAINCDFRAGAITPLQATLYVRDTGLGATGYSGSLPGIYRVDQLRTACLQIGSAALVAGSAILPAATAHPSTNIQANDELWYAVYLPASPSPVAGQGCIDLVVGGTTLGASIVDQNGLNAKTGNLSAYAAGKWYLRKIPLGGQLGADGAALTGRAISSIYFFQNHTNAERLFAYYAFAIVRNTSGAHQQTLYAPDMGQTAFTSTTSLLVRHDAIDSDDVAIMGPGVSAGFSSSLIQPPLAGPYKGKYVYYGLGADNGTMVRGINSTYVPHSIGNSGAYYVGGSIKDQTDSNIPVVVGWPAVKAPTAALSAPTVVGGVAADVTRSYVYTNRSEDGFESAPSPAVLHTGKPDGSWNFTGIPTWNGTDQYYCSVAGSMRHQRRIYRTPVGSSIYRLVGTLDDNDTAFNDAVTDANLGAELGSTGYANIPSRVTGAALWTGGMIAAISGGTELAISQPYVYTAWPLTQRYVIGDYAVAIGTFGDRLAVLTKEKPVVFSGSSSPDSLVQNRIDDGDACAYPRAVLSSPVGVIYPGGVGWGLINAGGYQNLTKPYFTEEQYAAVTNDRTVAMFDGRRLIWFTILDSTGYMLELGGAERGLVKFQSPDPLVACGYYAPRNNRWVAYTNGGLTKQGKLFASPSSKLKWTWTSKLHVLPAPISMAVAKVSSSGWAALSNSMKYRDGFRASIPAWVTSTAYYVGDFVTQGGFTYRCDIAHTSGVFATDLAAVKWVLTTAIYTIDITGLTQAEDWCYLKIWADADDASRKRLVFDDFVANENPVPLIDDVKSDCWQFEIRGNIEVTKVSIATSEGELNLQEE